MFKKRLRTLLCLVSVLVVLFGGVSVLSAGQSAAENEDVREIKEQLALVLEELRELRKDVQRLSAVTRATMPSPAPPPTNAVPDLTLDRENHAMLGDPTAKVAIVEFSDYQCPYCRRFHDQTFELLKKGYIDTGKAQYFFRDFPLQQIHPQAKPAAIAARCAGAQESYWEMHDALFESQASLGPALYTELASRLGLDVEAFDRCRQDPVHASNVEQDLAYGQSLGVRGTPHYFIGQIEGDRLTNVRRVSGAQSFGAFAEILSQFLPQ